MPGRFLQPKVKESRTFYHTKSTALWKNEKDVLVQTKISSTMFCIVHFYDYLRRFLRSRLLFKNTHQRHSESSLTTFNCNLLKFRFSAETRKPQKAVTFHNVRRAITFRVKSHLFLLGTFCHSASSYVWLGRPLRSRKGNMDILQSGNHAYHLYCSVNHCLTASFRRFSTKEVQKLLCHRTKKWNKLKGSTWNCCHISHNLHLQKSSTKWHTDDEQDAYRNLLFVRDKDSCNLS